MNRFDRERWDTMGKEALSRVEELMNTSRINELIHKREEDEKKKNCILWVLAIIGAVAAVAGIAYAVYRFFTPDYLEDFEDDFDDDFDDDFFEDEKAEEKKSEKKEERLRSWNVPLTVNNVNVTVQPCHLLVSIFMKTRGLVDPPYADLNKKVFMQANLQHAFSFKSAHG